MLSSQVNTTEVVSFQLFSRSSIEINGLQITPDMLGAKTSFDIDGHQVRVILPSINVLDIPETEYGNDLIEFHAWQVKDGKRVPQYFDVLKICIEIDVNEVIQLPAELLNVRNNAYELLSPTEELSLDKLAHDYELFADRIFDVWCKTARWKSRNGDIGRPSITHSRARSVRFCDTSTNKPIWLAGSGFTISGGKSKPISRSDWDAINQALLTYQRPPSYVDFYFDGIEHLKHGDLVRCVIDFAISAELTIRRNLRENLTKQLQAEITKRIVKAQITDIFPKYGPTIFGVNVWNKLNEGTKKTIHDLFMKRNLLVHYANSEGLSVHSCENYRQALAEILG